MEEEQRFTVVQVSPEAPGAYEALFVPEVLEAMRKRNTAVALGLEDGDTACGALGGFLEPDEEGNSFFLLSNFYISPMYRNMGGGSKLFETLLSLLDSSPSLPLYVLTEFDTESEETERLYQFLEEEGMKDVDPDSEDGELHQSMILFLRNPGKEAAWN